MTSKSFDYDEDYISAVKRAGMWPGSAAESKRAYSSLATEESVPRREPKLGGPQNLTHKINSLFILDVDKNQVFKQSIFFRTTLGLLYNQ